MADQVQVEREIAASPERVWELISDVTRMGEWSPETTSCRWLGGADAPEVGARFRGSNRSGWRRWTTVCTVTDAEPGGSFAFEVKGGPVPVARWAYEIEATDGGCRVTESWVDRRPRVFAVMMGPLSGVSDRAEHNRAGMEETLDRLAEAAER